MALENLPTYIDYLSQGVLALVIIATIIVRLTPSPKDDEKLDSFVTKLRKWMSYLPTFGINPKTKELEKKIDELKK